jgi:16S rRNA (cytidine1402-2'-O)-methyltransferase
VGILYVVATPIGNLQDVTLRAIDVLSKVSLIVAEDTRQTRKLLQSHGIRGKLISFNEHNQSRRLPSLLKALDEADIAIVADAGTPGISDPGRALVERAHLAGHRVVPVPGASAVTAALSVSGLDANSYVFLGFLPRRKGERRALLQKVSLLGFTLVLFEAPHRLRETMRDLLEILGNRRCLLAREITKLHEEVRLVDLASLSQEYETRPPLGEFTLVIEGGREPKDLGKDLRSIEERLRGLMDRGISPRDAVRLVARETGIRRQEVLRMWIRMQEGAPGRP